MTDQTKAALEQATKTLDAACTEVDREKRACLAQVAENLPARAAAAAKRVAIQQPEVTKSLGAEGVAKLRAELQAAAEELGRQFVSAIDEIKWPLGTDYSKVEDRHIHRALFDRFYRKTGALSNVLTSHGYELGQSDPFIPQSLYTESKFASLAIALTAVGRATRNVEAAKKKDNDANVDDLWG